MRVKFAFFVAALGMTVASLPLSAHHSFAAEFDDKSPVTLTGSVTKLEWMNPHARFYVDVINPKDDKGGVTHWEFELAALNSLIRKGWTRNSLKPGDVVTVEGFRAKDGTNLVNAVAVTLSGGKRIFAGSSHGDPDAKY